MAIIIGNASGGGGDSGTGLIEHLADAVGAHAATAISYTGSPNLASINVEAAIDELDAEKAALSHTHSATDIASGTVATARLGSGSANSATFLRGDQTWAEATGGGGGPAGAIAWVNVKTDHGAIGDDSTDDAVALQAAADAAVNGSGVYFPPGIYRTSKTIVFGLKRTGTTASDCHQEEPIVLFSPGAVLRTHSSFATGVTTPDEKPLMLVLASDARILYPRVQGTGNKGNGVGIRLGGGKNWRGADTITTTLSAAITTTGETTITVASATSFPDVDGFFIDIGGERMFVKNGAGTTTWTVTRGDDGGVAATTHSSGATVTLLGFQTVYRSSVYQPHATNLAAGLEFGVKENSSSSTGDCAVFGGYLTNSKIGLNSRGFVNRAFGITVTSCTVGIDVSDKRTSSKIELNGVTLNQCTNAALWVRGGEGTVVDGFWSEQTSGIATGTQIRIGQTSGTDGATASSTAYDTRIQGVVKVHPDTGVAQDEVVHIVRAIGLSVDTFTLSTNCDVAPAAFIRVDSTVVANANNRVKRIVAWPGTGGKNRFSGGIQPPLPVPVLYASPSTVNQLIVESHYETDVLSTVGTTIGGGDAYRKGTFTLFKSTANGVTTYFAKNAQGHVQSYGTDTASVSGLKIVLDALKATGVHFHFVEGTFSFLDDVAGQFNATFNTLHNLQFSGEGPQRTIIRSLSNATTGADNEPLSLTHCNSGSMRDLALRTEGVARQTSDAFDLDGGSDWLVKNVWVTAARGNGFHTDGKDDAAWPAKRIVFQSCLATGCQNDGFELLASDDCTIDNCSAFSNTGHGVQIAKASSAANIPNKKSTGNQINGGTFTENGQDGINILSSDRNRINGALCNNNANITASKDGVRIDTANAITADDNIINAVTAYDDQGTKTQRYGVNIGPALVAEANRNIVNACSLTGNLTGALSDTGTATDYSASTAAIQKALVDAKGDIIAATAADTVVRLAVGANGQILKANSATATGLEWVAEAAGGNLAAATKTANYTLTDSDAIIFGDATTASISLTLPTAVGRTGKRFYLKKIDTTGNSVTINPPGAETIDLLANAALAARNEAVILASDGVTWKVLADTRKGELTTKTAAYTVTDADSVILCNATSAAFTISLPTAVGRRNTRFHIKKIDSSANAVMIDPNSTQTIDGQTTFLLPGQWDAAILISDNANWILF